MGPCGLGFSRLTNALHVRLPLKITQKLQLVQNAMAHLISGTCWWEHFIHELQVISWLPTGSWLQLGVNLKSLYALAPSYLQDHGHLLELAQPIQSCWEKQPMFSHFGQVGKPERKMLLFCSNASPPNGLSLEFMIPPTLATFQKQLTNGILLGSV